MAIYVEKNVLFLKGYAEGMGFKSRRFSLDFDYARGSDKIEKIYVSVMCDSTVIVKDVEIDVSTYPVGQFVTTGIIERYANPPPAVKVEERSGVLLSYSMMDIDLDVGYALVIAALDEVGEKVVEVTVSQTGERVCSIGVPAPTGTDPYGMGAAIIWADERVRLTVDARNVSTCFLIIVPTSAVLAKRVCTLSVHEVGRDIDRTISTRFSTVSLEITYPESRCVLEQIAWGG